MISVVIVNHNAGALLSQCIGSLLNAPHVAEIIVVDNASTDDSLAILHGSSKIIISKNDKNVGFSRACNIGIKLAREDYVLFLNPDCLVSQDGLAQIHGNLIKYELAGMAGGLLVNDDGSEQGGGRRAVPTPWRSFVRAFGLYRFSNRWPRLFYDFHLHKQPLPSTPIDVEAISGACMLVKREAIDDVGLWDEDYFLHCEDLDWCMRFRQKGWEILFVPDAKIVHVRGACSRSRPIFVEWHKHKGMLRFYRKFFKHQYPCVLMWLVVIGVWFRFGLVAAYYLSNNVKTRLGTRVG